MTILTRWVQNHPGKALLAHCRAHVMDDNEFVPVMDEWYLAHRPRTSTLQGKINACPIAVKVWRGVPVQVYCKEKFTKQLSYELDRWRRASSHPYIAPFFGVMSGFGDVPSLVQPLYAYGNINKYLKQKPDKDPLSMLFCVADGLAFMHNLTPPVIHGGVRGANILISDEGVPLLSDVSVCSMPLSRELMTIGSGHLSVRWMAPEVVGGDDDDDDDDDEMNHRSSQSDVYSYGMTILEVLSGRHPFAHRRSPIHVTVDVKQGIRPRRPVCAKLTDPLWNVLQSCWKQDPQERPEMHLVKTWMQLICLIQKDSGGESSA